MAFSVGRDCKIHPSALINVKHGFIGDGAVINEGARIEGYRVEIGRESFIDRLAVIGGGSCFDPQAYLIAGDWLHLGVSAQINTARGVRVGHERGGDRIENFYPRGLPRCVQLGGSGAMGARRNRRQRVVAQCVGQSRRAHRGEYYRGRA